MLRLSYHSKNHYNAVTIAAEDGKMLLEQSPGIFENIRILHVAEHMDPDDIPETFTPPE